MPNGSLNIEATIKASNLDDIRFVTMKGDYGWGLYLSEGYMGMHRITVFRSIHFLI